MGPPAHYLQGGTELDLAFVLSGRAEGREAQLQKKLGLSLDGGGWRWPTTHPVSLLLGER